MKEYDRSTKRYTDDQNNEEEHGWIGIGYYSRTLGETSNCGSNTTLDVAKLSWLLVGYSGRLLKQAHSSSDGGHSVRSTGIPLCWILRWVVSGLALYQLTDALWS
jgi:hypothetical protein